MTRCWDLRVLPVPSGETPPRLDAIYDDELTHRLDGDAPEVPKDAALSLGADVRDDRGAPLPGSTQHPAESQGSPMRRSVTSTTTS